jgi:hypothetical protein
MPSLIVVLGTVESLRMLAQKDIAKQALHHP